MLNNKLIFFHIWLFPNGRSHTTLASPPSVGLDSELTLEQFSHACVTSARTKHFHDICMKM